MQTIEKGKEVIIHQEGLYKGFKGRIVRDRGQFFEVRTIRARDGKVVQRLILKEYVEFI